MTKGTWDLWNKGLTFSDSSTRRRKDNACKKKLVIGAVEIVSIKAFALYRVVDPSFILRTNIECKLGHKIN